MSELGKHHVGDCSRACGGNRQPLRWVSAEPIALQSITCTPRDSALLGHAGYLFGVVGRVVGTVGGVVDQDTVSRHNAEGPPEPVYRCAFSAAVTSRTPVDEPASIMTPAVERPLIAFADGTCECAMLVILLPPAAAQA